MKRADRVIKRSQRESNFSVYVRARLRTASRAETARSGATLPLRGRRLRVAQ